MTIDGGQLPSARAALSGRFRADCDDGIPPSPPPEVVRAIEAARRTVAELALRGREVHFRHDAESRRLVIELRTLAGDVLETLTPSAVFDILDGGRAR